jgi:hypothetical protein
MRPPPARLAASPCGEVKGTGARSRPALGWGCRSSGIAAQALRLATPPLGARSPCALSLVPHSAQRSRPLLIGRPFLSAIAMCHQVAVVSAVLGSSCAEPRTADTTAPFPCGRGRSAASVPFVSQSLNARALPIFAALMLATFRPTAARPTEKSGSASRLCFSPCPSAASLPKAEVGRLRDLRQCAELSPSLPVSFGYRDVY